jgi:gliding motility associated protien GldN
MTKRILVGLALMMTGSFCFAQDEAQVDPNSMLKIPKYEQMYKIKVWRTINLKEKQNKGFYAKNAQITKLILKAVESGEITDFYEADLTTKIPKEKFMSSLLSKEGVVFTPWVPTQDYPQGDKASFNGVNYEASDDQDAITPDKDRSNKFWKKAPKGKTPYPAWSAEKAYNRGERVVFDGANYEAVDAIAVINPSTDKDHWTASPEGKPIKVNPEDISKLTLVENVIFDKRRSRLYYDILAIELKAYILLDPTTPSPEHDPSQGSFKSLGWIWYKDLEAVFRKPEHSGDAIWFNRYNMAEKRNYGDAFLLRLFHATIDKVENPDDETIFETYNNNRRPYKEAVFATEWEEMRLMEKEHNLWEY